ncbi:MAG: hypothetical protein ACHQ03_11755 [Candidatus Bathyarchaeia archaeon]
MAKHYYLRLPPRRYSSAVLVQLRRPQPRRKPLPIPRPRPVVVQKQAALAVIEPASRQRKKARSSRRYRISPIVRRMYDVWYRQFARDRQFEEKRKLLPVGALQKWYEFRKAAFGAKGGDPDVFDDKLDDLDVAIASDSWHDLDSELERHNLYQDALTAKEIVQKAREEMREEKRIEKMTEQYEKDKAEAKASIGKYPKLPRQGITPGWLQAVLRIDPHLDPSVEKKRSGFYNLSFYKMIEGQPTPLYSAGEYHLENVIDMLAKHTQEFEVPRRYDVEFAKGKWGKSDIERALSLPEIQDDLKTYYRKYTRDELKNLSDRELNRIAIIKAGNELNGGTYKWNRSGTDFVKVRGRKLASEQKRREYIAAIIRRNGQTTSDSEVYSVVNRSGIF